MLRAAQFPPHGGWDGRAARSTGCAEWRQRRTGTRPLILEHQTVAKSAVVAPMPKPLGVGFQARRALRRTEIADMRSTCRAVSIITSCAPIGGSHLLTSSAWRGRFSGRATSQDTIGAVHRRKHIRHDANPPASMRIDLLVDGRRGAVFLPRAERAIRIAPGERRSRRPESRQLSRRRGDSTPAEFVRTRRHDSSATMTVRPVSQSVRNSGTVRPIER